MRAFIINLDSAPERWASVSRSFGRTRFTICRVAAVDGYALKLPIKEYAEWLYRWFHGRPTSPGHVGCYLSHVNALRDFLKTEDAYGLIVEDDVALGEDFEAVVVAALLQTRWWNVLRLSGLGDGSPVKIASLQAGSDLCVGFGRLKETGVYVVDRVAAKA